MWENVKGMLALPDDPAQRAAAKQGLLNFGASLLAGQGNLGGILGNGLLAGSQGYQGALAQQQQTALRQAQMQQIEIENKQRQAAIDKPGRIASAFAGLRAPGAAEQVATAGTPDSSRPRRPPALDAGLEGYKPGVMSLADVPKIGDPPRASAGTAAAAPTDWFAFYRQRADKLTELGYTDDAKDMYAIAEKLRPKLKEQRALTVDGKRVMANVFEDGRTEQLDGFAPDLEKLHFANTGGSTIGQDQFTGEVRSTIKNTVSPDAQLSSDTARRGQNMADARAKADEQAPISADAILNAAARYNFDGTLPPMGMGKNAAAGRSAILNKAAELKYGVDPEQQRRDQMTNKGKVAAENAAVKSFSDGRLGSTVRSFNVSISHLNTLDELTDALHNGDAQALNRASNYFKSQTGNPAPTNFEAAKKVVADEVVKAIVGTGGGVTDREEAAKTIAAANSPAQLRGVIGTYKELMRGQLHGLQQQYEVSTGRTDFDKFLSPAAKAVDKQHGQIKDVKDLPKKAAPAGHPADISNLLNKYGAK